MADCSLHTMNIFFLLSSLAAAVFLFFHFTRSKGRVFTPTGLRYHPLLGHLPQFVRNRHRFLEWITEVMAETPTNTMLFLSPFSTSGVITANPANVEHILKENFLNYPKGERSISNVHDFLGDGIFNSDGEQWRWQRKVASFEFNTKSLRIFVMDTVQQEITGRLLPLLCCAAEEGRTLDLQDIFERFGFDNICKVSFGEDPAGLTPEKLNSTSSGSPPDFMRAFGEAQNLVMLRLMEPFEWIWKMKKRLNIGYERRLREMISIVHGYAEGIIRARKGMREDQSRDLLSRIAAANREITEQQLRDFVISFIIAGRETTSSALTWFFWILATRPDVERRILDEIRLVRKDRSSGGIGFSYEELREMQYLQAAVTESMRLYPPVPIDSLSCAGDDMMPDGTMVRKGQFVIYSSYTMGRLEDVWGKGCSDYVPERWLDGAGGFRAESPFRYPVFHAGPRACLGKEMAYLQMKSIIACVLERFQIDVVDGRDEAPEHVLSFTLRMKGGLLVRVKERGAQDTNVC